MLPLDECDLPRGGPGPEQRSQLARRSLAVVDELSEGRREQLVHDVWALRSLFASSEGPWRRAGFATRVLVRASAAEMERLGSLHCDPLNEAFWLLAEQAHLLNLAVVEPRVVRVLFRESGRLRPSVRRAASRLLQLRAENLAHRHGGPASNLLLLAVLAGGMAAAYQSQSLQGAVATRFPSGIPYVPRDEVDSLLLGEEAKKRLDARARALDLLLRTSGAS